MLIIYRRVGESIFIGDDIRLTLLRVNGRNWRTRRVRVGIAAPEGIDVRRKGLPATADKPTKPEDD